MTALAQVSTKHFDVLIVGAGISGIGAAYHLKTELPGKTFAILEGREAIGGTWDLFRYPGIRSDSDLHTFGYEFKPWTSDNAIAGADEILAYLRETVEENDLGPHIRFGHKIVSADWSSEDARWTVRVERAAGEHDRADVRGPLLRGRLLRLRRRATRRSSRAVNPSRARLSTRSTGPRTTTTRASAW